MSDLFHEEVPSAYLDKVFDTIRKTPWHTYQILTKQDQRMADYCRSRSLPDTVWLGVTVENIKSGLPRIDHLRDIDVSIRFISMEPLLEDLGAIDLSGIHWVIVGGESGAKARPMEKSFTTGGSPNSLTAR